MQKFLNKLLGRKSKSSAQSQPGELPPSGERPSTSIPELEASFSDRSVDGTTDDITDIIVRGLILEDARPLPAIGKWEGTQGTEKKLEKAMKKLEDLN